MTQQCTLGELDEVLASLADQEHYIPDEIIIEEEKGEYAIFVNDLRILIPSLSLELREGYYGRWQEDEDYYMADFGLTAIYKMDAAPEDYLLWAQGSPLIALYNYTHTDMDALASTPCTIVFPDGK